ncbi:MAG: ABC transporter permease [Anaerolineae bacterium]|nr:ABC transporter permease [Anaerolineae bacterium]
MKNLSLWLRWSWRDLRERWLQVIAIAMIIALGTGVFAGLGGQETWRIDSFELSYERLHMFDIKMQLTDGSYVDDDLLVNTLEDIEGIAALEPRLITPTLVDASTEDETIIVQGRTVGMDVSDGGPDVNGLFVDDAYGRSLTGADAGRNAVVVEYKFADHYGLRPGDPIRISGDIQLDFVGAGHAPEYFVVMPETFAFLAESSFAVLFMPLDTAQTLAGREGLVNDAVFLLDKNADREQVRAVIEDRMAGVFPDTGFTITYQEDDPVREMMYADAKNDQGTWQIVAMLFLIGAALGAFNLAGRIVESQRRQIGIGMALGVPRLWIAFRPMLIGLQIAVLGTIFGLIAGIVLSNAFFALFESMLPLPYWKSSFYVPGFVQATVLGILLPFIATLVPVIRAVRVPPIDAIQSGYLVAKDGGLSWVMNYLPLPGKSFTHMPFKNILRSPWRSLMTVMGISMAILLMTAFIGMMDTFRTTVDRGSDATLYRSPDRLVVGLDFFYPVNNGEITAIESLKQDDGTPYFSQVDTTLSVGGHLGDGDDTFDIMIGLQDMDSVIWAPDLLEGELKAGEPGIVISEKAALDLDVAVGDTITVEHPRREGLLSFRLVKTDMPVIGIHSNPIRALSYMDISSAESMGLAGVTNQIVVNPAEGVDPDAIKGVLMQQPGVASVQSVREFIDVIDDFLEIFSTVLGIVQVIVMLLAFLIAFNSTSINVDERVREIATMFAFGLPIRTVTRMQMIENLIMGVLGTIVGIVAGWLVLNAMLAARIETQLADLKLIVNVSPVTLMISAALGVLVVALTPLLSIRRMSHMDVPSTLRVME